MLQPQQGEGEGIVRRVRCLSLGHSQYRDVRGTAAKNAAGVVAREGVLEIRRDRQRFESFIGELFREKVSEAISKFFAREFPRAALEFPADKLKPVRLRAPKSLYRQRQPLLGMVNNCQDAPREIELL